MRNILAVVLFLLAMPAGAVEWVKYGETADGVSVYFDPNSIRVDGKLRRVWKLMDLKEPFTVAGRSVRALYELDCAQERSQTLQVTWFSGQMLNGKVLDSTGETDWKFVAPGSIGEDLLKIVCQR